MFYENLGESKGVSSSKCKTKASVRYAPLVIHCGYGGKVKVKEVNARVVERRAPLIIKRGHG